LFGNGGGGETQRATLDAAKGKKDIGRVYLREGGVVRPSGKKPEENIFSVSSWEKRKGNRLRQFEKGERR